jgi:hypothetical protein
MPIAENTAERLILKSGSATLTLSKEAGKAILQRKFLFWNLKPSETLLSEVSEITVDANVDRASGVEVCSTMLILRTGAAWSFPATDRKDAQTTADAIRRFLSFSA